MDFTAHDIEKLASMVRIELNQKEKEKFADRRKKISPYYKRFSFADIVRDPPGECLHYACRGFRYALDKPERGDGSAKYGRKEYRDHGIKHF